MRDGKLHWKNRDLTGQTFGELLAVRPVGSDGKKMRWEFRCSCGNLVVKCGADVTKEVKRGGRPNCGCMTRRLIGEKNTKHGMSAHPAYAVWRALLDRCRLPSHQAWKNYGGRGIAVCERWQASFENFWADMGETYQHGLDIDRIDNSKGYCPENCHWTTRIENCRNKRNTRIPGWALDKATESGVNRSTLYYRVEHGLPLEQACRLPPSFAGRLSDRPTISLSADPETAS